MFRITILALTLLISSAFAKSGHCTEFLVWNPATRDTLFSFVRKAEDKSTTEGFYWLPFGLFRMDGSELRVPNTLKSQ